MVGIQKIVSFVTKKWLLMHKTERRGQVLVGMENSSLFCFNLLRELKFLVQHASCELQKERFCQSGKLCLKLFFFPYRNENRIGKQNNLKF